jgi:hypothetical protein
LLAKRTGRRLIHKDLELPNHFGVLAASPIYFPENQMYVGVVATVFVLPEG